MDYSLRLTLGALTGGLGIIGRFVIAMGILALIKFADKNNAEVDKGIKKLLIGRLITAVLGAFLAALVAGMYFTGITLPFWFIFD